MDSVLLTELAILPYLYPVGMSLLVFGSVIIAVLALCTCKRDPCTHGFSSVKNAYTSPF